MVLTREQADAAYTILVRHAHARDGRHDREAFVHHVAHPDRPANEYRFIGSLGFGGKFRNYRGGIPYVDCYPEDMTPARKASILATNAFLGELFS